jgi:hypothetical protein
VTDSYYYDDSIDMRSRSFLHDFHQRDSNKNRPKNCVFDSPQQFQTKAGFKLKQTPT